MRQRRLGRRRSKHGPCRMAPPIAFFCQASHSRRKWIRRLSSTVVWASPVRIWGSGGKRPGSSAIRAAIFFSISGMLCDVGAAHGEGRLVGVIEKRHELIILAVRNRH